MTNKIDLSNLAQQMLNWEKKRRELDELEEAIKDTVLQLQKTQTAGNVRATYTKPRSSSDYEQPCRDLLQVEESRAGVQLAILDNTRKVVDWKAVAAKVGADPVVTEGKGPGSVSIKLLG